MKGINKFRSLIGKSLIVDKNIENKMGLNFAKLLVEVKIGSHFPEMIHFQNEKGV